MIKNKNLFKVGQILKMPGISADIFYGFPTAVQMVKGFDFEKIMELSEKWGNRRGILKIIDRIEEYKKDVSGLIPDDIIKRISKDAIFETSGIGIVYVYPFREIEITNVILVSQMQGKNYYEYEFDVAGIGVCSVHECKLLRALK